MLYGLYPIPALLLVAWGLWNRRTAVGCYWEREATLALILLAAGSILASPNMDPINISAILHHITGLWNIDALVGETLIVWSALLMCHMLIHRAYRHEHAAHLYRWATTPTLITAIPGAAAWFIGGACCEPGAIDNWNYSSALQMHWLLVYGILCYLMIFALVMTAILFRAPRHRVTAWWYMTSFTIGAAFAAVRFTQTITHQPIIPGFKLASLLGLLWMASFAAASGYSWRRKIKAVQPNRMPEGHFLKVW